MTEEHVLERLRQVLNKHKVRLGSWVKLEEELDRVNGKNPERVIERRTLKRLCGEGVEGVRLSIAQLIGLDHFFAINNEGALLASSLSLIDSIVESFEVNFLVAANYVPAIQDDAIARWDLRAITCLTQTRLKQVQHRIRDITGADNWHKDDSKKVASGANIAVGSPVANFASDALLCDMLGIALEDHPPSMELPFFIVAAKRDEKLTRLKSPFVRGRREAVHVDAAGVAALEQEKRAVVLGGRLYVSTAERDYGLLVAQRDRNGQARMVVCGLTGQATYQLARILHAGEPARTLPPHRDGDDHPPILVALYELMMVPDPHARGRNTHRVSSYSAVDRPAFLHYAGGQWQFVGG